MSNLFRKALASLKESKNLDTVLTGSGFLDEGVYPFTVQAVDTSEINDNKVKVSYVTDTGQQFTDFTFFANKDGTGISKGLQRLLAGVFSIEGKEAAAKLLQLLDADDSALEMLTGMKFQATLKRGRGFHCHSVAAGGYAAFDATTKEQIGEVYADLAEARAQAEAAGHKRSYVRIDSVKATHVAENLAAFEKAVAGRGKPAAAPKLSKAI